MSETKDLAELAPKVTFIRVLEQYREGKINLGEACWLIGLDGDDVPRSKRAMGDLFHGLYARPSKARPRQAKKSRSRAESVAWVNNSELSSVE